MVDEDKPLMAGQEDVADGLQDSTKKAAAAGSQPPDERMERRYLLLVLPLVISCCIYFATRSYSTHRASPTLVKAIVAFRHGSRAPIFTYANDQFSMENAKLWPEGRDKLTKKGKLEAYRLGERLRERYGDFLGQFYLPAEVRAFSTLKERTLMSGQLVLSSLFPPTGYQLWNQELNWQPVPIYPEYIFNSTVGGGCPKFSMEAKTNLINEFHQLSPQAKETMSLVMKHAGEPNGKPYEVFGKVWDSVYFQDKADLPVPEWLKEAYPEKMSRAALAFTMAFLTGSEVQRKLVLHNYAHAVRNFLLAEDERKMEIHSWHDLNNMALMKAFGIEIKGYPEPTSCLVLEMHNRRGRKFFEVYYYDNYNSKEPRPLEMPCGISCSVEDLENIAIQYRIDNYTEVCQSVDHKVKKSDKFFHLIEL